MNEHEPATPDESKAQIARRRFLKGAAATAWAAPFVFTIAPKAHAAISPLPCGTQGMPCGPSAPIGGPDTCCNGLTCVQTQGSGDPALITFTCQP